MKIFTIRTSEKFAAVFVMAALVFVTRTQAQSGETVLASVTITAKVISISQTTRRVAVKSEDGKTQSFIAGDDVVNLAQIKKGDLVKAVYYEAVGYQIRKHHTQTGAMPTDAFRAAELGHRPAGTVTQQTKVAVTIIAIDSLAPSVSFMSREGETQTLKIKNSKKLIGLKLGDVVDVTYTEAVAISVHPAPK